MYKIASKNRQEAVDRLTLGDLAGGEERARTDEEIYQDRKRRVQTLERQIKDAPNKQEKRRLGLKHQAAIQELRAVKPKKKSPGIESIFVSIARERLTRPQFKLIWDEALKQYDEAQDT